MKAPEPNSARPSEVAENVSPSVKEKGIIEGQGASQSAPTLLDPETIERLGRQRPPHFSSIWTELAFCFSIFMCQILSV